MQLDAATDLQCVNHKDQTSKKKIIDSTAVRTYRPLKKYAKRGFVCGTSDQHRRCHHQCFAQPNLTENCPEPDLVNLIKVLPWCRHMNAAVRPGQGERW